LRFPPISHFVANDHPLNIYIFGKKNTPFHTRLIDSTNFNLFEAADGVLLIFQNSRSIIFIRFQEWAHKIVDWGLNGTPQILRFGYIFHENKMTKTHLNTLAMLNLVNLAFFWIYQLSMCKAGWLLQLNMVVVGDCNKRAYGFLQLTQKRLEIS
jgi:hypothetical protein